MNIWFYSSKFHWQMRLNYYYLIYGESWLTWINATQSHFGHICVKSNTCMTAFCWRWLPLTDFVSYWCHCLWFKLYAIFDSLLPSSTIFVPRASSSTAVEVFVNSNYVLVGCCHHFLLILNKIYNLFWLLDVGNNWNRMEIIVTLIQFQFPKLLLIKTLIQMQLWWR